MEVKANLQRDVCNWLSLSPSVENSSNVHSDSVNIPIPMMGAMR